MPDKKQAEANIALVEKLQFKNQKKIFIIAPQYPSGELDRSFLLSQIEENRPSSVFIQVGGGVQERLGLYLKENLSYLPSIYCTGAALAFFPDNRQKSSMGG